MKNFAAVIFVLLSITCQSQASRVAKLFQSLFGQTERKAINYASKNVFKKEASTLYDEYRALNAAERRKFFDNFEPKYKTHASILTGTTSLDLKFEKLYQSTIKTDIVMGYPTVDYNTIDTKYVQDLLSKMGYPIEKDGIMGTKTKAALTEFLGEDLYAGRKTVSSAEVKQKMHQRCFQLAAEKSPVKSFKEVKGELRNENGEIVEVVSLKSKSEYDAFIGKFECSFEEACIGFQDPSLSGTFSCQRNGVKISVHLSSEGDFDLKLKSRTGESITIAHNSDGSIQMSSATKNRSQSTTFR